MAEEYQYIIEKPISITHSQVIVFDQSNPRYLLWTDEHVAQGFGWLNGSISFGVPDRDGWPLVRLKILDEFPPPLTPDVRRAIRVPFHSNSNIVIATIVDDIPTPIGAGDYSIEFRIVDVPPPADDLKNASYIIDFLIKKGTSDEFKILRRSDEVTSDDVITKTGKPVGF